MRGTIEYDEDLLMLCAGYIYLQTQKKREKVVFW